MCEELKKTVEKAWDNRELLGDERVKQAIRDAIDLLDKGKLRTCLLYTSPSPRDRG